MKKSASVLALAMVAAFCAPAFASYSTTDGAKAEQVAKKGKAKKAKAAKA